MVLDRVYKVKFNTSTVFKEMNCVYNYNDLRSTRMAVVNVVIPTLEVTRGRLWRKTLW